jgi:hypothetical protein
MDTFAFILSSEIFIGVISMQNGKQHGDRRTIVAGYLKLDVMVWLLIYLMPLSPAVVI